MNVFLKRLGGLMFCLMLCQSLFAQQKPWFPFQFGQVSYYSDTTIFPPTTVRQFFTLSADSMLVNNGDTIIYFNRKLFANESLCTQPGSTLWNTVYDQAFQFSIMQIDGDSVWFNNEIHAWNFNQPLNIPLNSDSACGGIYKYSITWYDAQIQDSIRSVDVDLINGGTVNDVMRVSKYHGLVYFNSNYDSLNICHTGQFPLRLCGYKKDVVEWGFKPPTIERYFQFYPGDIIKNYSYVSWPWIGPSYTTWDSVSSVIQIGDSLVVNVHRVSTFFNTDGTIDTVYHYYGGINYSLGPYKSVFQRTNGMNGVGYPWTSTIPRIQLYTESTECGTDTLFEMTWGALNFNEDSCQLYAVNISSETRDTYSSMRGFISSIYTDANAGTIQLGLYSPARDIACGNWFPVSIEKHLKALYAQISPNPPTDKLTINFHQPITGTLQIIDATGRQLQTQQLNANALVVTNVEALPSGIYFIRVQSKDSVYTDKFIKQ